MDMVDGEDGRGNILEYLEYDEAIGNRDLGDVKVFKWIQWLIGSFVIILYWYRITMLSGSNSFFLIPYCYRGPP